MNKLKVGSLFAGIGGIDLAFEQADFEIAWANEIDAAACNTLKIHLAQFLQQPPNPLHTNRRRVCSIHHKRSLLPLNAPSYTHLLYLFSI